MAKVVIAGKCDCPFLARVELLADKLALDLPDFVVTKIVKKPDQWEEFTQWVLNKHGWVVHDSPVIWRELIDRNGKGSLIGGSNDFEEFVASFYGKFSSMTTNEMLKVAEDNTRFKISQEREDIEELEKSIPPSTVILIGEPSAATAFFVSALGSGAVFGNNEYVSVHLYNPGSEPDLLHDFCSIATEASLECLAELKVVTDLTQSLATAKQIIIHNIVPRAEYSTPPTDNSSESGLESRENWLKRRYDYLKILGELFREHCPLDVRILVASNLKVDGEGWNSVEPMNFDVTALYQTMRPKFSTHQILGLVRPMELKLKSIVAKELKVKTLDVTNLVIWGNMYNHMFVDLSQSQVYRRKEPDTGIVAGSWYSAPTIEVAPNPKILKDDLLTMLQEKERTFPIKQGLNQGHAMTTFLRECWQGTDNSENKIASVVLCSEGWYDVPSGIAFSFPVTESHKSCWSVVEDMPLTDKQLDEMRQCIRSVLEDWAVVDPEPLIKFIKPRQESIYKEVIRE